MRLTKNHAQEVLHKLCILADEPDLQSDYGLTQEQADALCNNVPPNGGEWNFSKECEAAVKGEMADHATILRDIANDARKANQFAEASRINKLAKRFEEGFK